MKKLALLALLALTFFSCSNDDSLDTPLPMVTVPGKITVTAGSDSYSYTFAYDGKRRVSKVVRTDGTNTSNLLFSYNNAGQITKVAVSGFGENTYTFTYKFGRLSHISDNTGFDEDVFYNTVNKEYHMNTPNSVFSFEDNGDLRHFDNYYFTYDLSKKSGFANVNGSYQLLGALGLDPYWNYFTSKLPMVYYGFEANPMMFSIENDFNVLGYITKAGLPTIDIKYEYTKAY